MKCVVATHDYCGDDGGCDDCGGGVGSMKRERILSYSDWGDVESETDEEREGVRVEEEEDGDDSGCVGGGGGGGRVDVDDDGEVVAPNMLNML